MYNTSSHFNKYPHFPIGARCTREPQHALPRLKNKLGYLRAHADVIFCHMHMTWCTCACTYVLYAHVCAQIQHFLTFQNFASHVHVSDRCTLQLPAGVTACVAMLPRLKNKRVRMQMSRTMSCTCNMHACAQVLPHISAFCFACPHLDVHVARASQHAL